MTKRKSLRDAFPHVMDRAYKQYQQRQNIFYFYTGLGNYTGMSAQSLREFADAVTNVNVASLEFHVSGGDFERWVTDKGFPRLATRFQSIRKRNVQGEPLRQQLSKAIRAFLIAR